ncbi:helix-turn-helix transcriptional regulator [Halorarum halobium]|uniref:helix-turn-helix transcriptional regulator n=1 Tax=Halorarum halobium TaxID=3075121 RepID=UPI0028ADE3B4|nr:helix-turn-helix transcriptional regulator [Halobaculum sp. XH14]
MGELSGFQRDLLYTIPGLDRPSGRTIAEEVERTFERSVSHGLLYPNLNELVEANLVVKGEIDRRTNAYELTPVGRERAEERVRWERDRLGVG